MYNKSEIMKSAWTLYRKGEKTFAECLHKAWVVAKMAIIGNLWEKYGKRRIYFGSQYLLSLCGVEIDRYRTGNISYCAVSGERTSNADGYRWVESTSHVYYDMDKDTLAGRGVFIKDVFAAIRREFAY